LLVDYVGRFENLAEDFKVVAARIGLPSGELPRLNSTASRDYKTVYNDRTVSAVHQMFQDDIETYGYAF
jgi:hypothetical protein